MSTTLKMSNKTIRRYFRRVVLEGTTRRDKRFLMRSARQNIRAVALAYYYGPDNYQKMLDAIQQLH